MRHLFDTYILCKYFAEYVSYNPFTDLYNASQVLMVTCIVFSNREMRMKITVLIKSLLYLLSFLQNPRLWV